MSDYGRLLIHMLNCTNLKIMNGTNAFPMTKVLTCLAFSRGGSVVDYVLMQACDISIVSAFRIGSLSPNSDHKPLYLDITITSFITKCDKVEKERRCIMLQKS